MTRSRAKLITQQVQWRMVMRNAQVALAKLGESIAEVGRVMRENRLQHDTTRSEIANDGDTPGGARSRGY